MSLRTAVKPFRCLLRRGILLEPRTRLCSQEVVELTKNTSDKKDNAEETTALMSEYRRVMSAVPQPVVVVTTSLDSSPGPVLKRGVTCSSFTSVSLNPPIISFTMNRPSRMHDLITTTRRFAVHVLGQNQVDLGIHFSQPAQDGRDQFHSIPHAVSERGNPVLDNSVAVIECEMHSIHGVGDHHVWYGRVESCQSSETCSEPLIYFARSYRSVSDELLMRAFESTELPFEEWTHNAHLRMCWNYLQEYGFEKAQPLIRNGIRKYNEKNFDKLERGYHETVTSLFIHLVNYAINNGPKHENFEDFIEMHSYLADSKILFRYYSPIVLNSPEARHSFVPPDKNPLP